MNRKVLSGILVAAVLAACSALGADVYRDAVFWFRGGKDANGDGLLNTSTSNKEFFNELKAADPNHASQTCIARGYADGIALETEPVVFPCQPNVTQDLQCIRFKQELHLVDNGDGSITTNAWPNQLDLPVGNLITGEQYACVIRLRRDGSFIPNRTEDLLALGYNNPIGWLLRFTGSDTSGTRYITVYVKDSATWEIGDTSMVVATNEWMDIGMSVSKLANGKTKVRLALARAGTPVMFNSFTAPVSQSFNSYTSSNARAAWRLGAQTRSANSQLQWTSLTNGTYRYSAYPFRGSVQQLAYWNRPLSDDELYEAFGMPRPNLMQVGVGNGGSDEFGAARTGVTQAFNASAQTLRDRTSVLAPDDEWTVNFTVNAQEAGMAQFLTFASTTNSSSCLVRAAVNGTPLGSKIVPAGGASSWFVPGSAMQAGANVVTLKRVDAGAGAVQMDYVKLGGSWQAGTKNSSNKELVGEQKMCSPFFSSADLGWKHWSSPLTTYHGGLSALECTPSNQVYHIWVDDVAARFCPSTFSTVFERVERSTRPTTGTEYVNIFVNGVLKRYIPLSETPTQKWVLIELPFELGELHAGWNEIRFAASPTSTCYWYRDYFRFELGKIANGTVLLLR